MDILGFFLKKKKKNLLPMLEPSEGIVNLADATFFYYFILENLLPKVLGLNLLVVVF